MGENFEVCLEAETQDGSAPVTNDPNASNGGTRGDESSYRHYVNYAVNNVPADGMYLLALRYSASVSPKVTLSGNDGYMYHDITIPATNSWNIVFREEIFNVPLRAGVETGQDLHKEYASKQCENGRARERLPVLRTPRKA